MRFYKHKIIALKGLFPKYFTTNWSKAIEIENNINFPVLGHNKSLTLFQQIPNSFNDELHLNSFPSVPRPKKSKFQVLP